MIKKLFAAVILAAVLLTTCCAEVIRIGSTPCLFQPASQEDQGKRYALFVGSGDYFQATRNCADLSAAHGTLLIPQGDGRLELCSRASDQVIADIKATILSWAEEGSEVILVGYSAGGYPATALAIYLAQAGYTGRLYLLDGIYGDYRGITYNAGYYRANLDTWDVTMIASSSTSHNISERSRAVGEAMAEDAFLTYRWYDATHEDLKDIYVQILNDEYTP